MSTYSARGLWAEFRTGRGPVRAVDGADFDLRPGIMTGVIGESGSGKSTLGLAMLGLTPGPGATGAERLELEGENLLGLSEREWRRYRGGRIGLIVQHPRGAFSPVKPIGEQIAEHYRAHCGGRLRDARERALSMLEAAGLRQARRQFGAYPHEISGGMAQRALIAMALSTDPALLIADEPTTALDATIQAQVLDLLTRLKDERGLSVLLITHSMGVVQKYCQDLYVMTAGHLAHAGDRGHWDASPAWAQIADRSTA